LALEPPSKYRARVSFALAFSSTCRNPMRTETARELGFHRKQTVLQMVEIPQKLTCGPNMCMKVWWEVETTNS
jgi:hypothetical protein